MKLLKYIVRRNCIRKKKILKSRKALIVSHLDHHIIAAIMSIMLACPIARPLTVNGSLF